ncbi:hypothetical protein I350_00163 [Cryptococcus amylolentus CBS 6273]|uniref:Peptidase A1 domain-containing protein n=1 Tax=Cryptococcus amylolentus CBS 6273 TaxID=1296118 RepID=A0A1E3KE52_9TREE|nr:hypothetical protein I350_00163 [Cryptococcus amylolentus CBS 6273]
MFAVPFALLIYLFILTVATKAQTTFKLTKHSTGATFGILRKIESLGTGSNRRRDVEIDGSSSGGKGYTIDVSLNGGSSIPVLLDTGSNQFWAASTACDSCTSGGMQSSGLEAESGCEVYGLTYGIGSVKGCIVESTMAVGEWTVDNLHALAISYVDDDMLWEGSFMRQVRALGFGSRRCNEAPVVGFYLGREGDGTESEMTIGDVSSISYAQTSKKVTVPSRNNTYDLYQVSMDSISVNGKTLESDIVAYIDTGSTAISTPETLAGEIYIALFDGIAYKYGTSYIVPCEPLTNASIAFTFGGVAFDMASEDLVGDDIADNSGWCYGRFVSLYEGVDYMVIGDAFLHNVYHTVNVQNGDVTFYALS